MTKPKDIAKCGEKALPEPVPAPRILFTSKASNKMNPFVNIIYDKLWRLGCDVDNGVDKFWSCIPTDYDVLQLEWPEDLVRWKLADLTDDQLGALEKRLAAFKAAGCKICYTRHNTIPHSVQNDLTARLYRIVENAADAVFHMAEYSKKEFQQSHHTFADCRHLHFVIPHHTYDCFDRSITQSEARARLGIDSNAKVVLAFGAFRNEDERNLVREAVAKCKLKNLMLLAPQLDGGRVSDEELPDYFAASDVVFIQRIHILNSGNLPMAFYFGKVVVGPDAGNVGEILQASGNPVFVATSFVSIAEAIKAGLALSITDLGDKNRALADREWDSPLVARKMLSAYEKLLNEDFSRLPRRFTDNSFVAQKMQGEDVKAKLEKAKEENDIKNTRLANLGLVQDLCRFLQSWRIDMITTDAELKNLELYSEDDNFNIARPSWLNRNEKSGWMISGSGLDAKLFVKVKHAGKLLLFLCGVDAHSRIDGSRYPIYSDYLSVKLNDHELLPTPVQTSQDEQRKIVINFSAPGEYCLYIRLRPHCYSQSEFSTLLHVTRILSRCSESFVRDLLHSPAFSVYRHDEQDGRTREISEQSERFNVIQNRCATLERALKTIRDMCEEKV